MRGKADVGGTSAHKSMYPTQVAKNIEKGKLRVQSYLLLLILLGIGLPKNQHNHLSSLFQLMSFLKMTQINRINLIETQ